MDCSAKVRIKRLISVTQSNDFDCIIAGIFELYRILLCIWPLYHHGFFLIRENGTFTYPQLTVDFFFIISGFFLISSMRKLKKENIWIGTKKLMFSRLTPILSPLLACIVFNALCMILFIRSDIFNTLFINFRYWWYILYLVLGIALLFFAFRLIKNEKLYIIFLVALLITMGVFHYFLEIREFFIYEFTYMARTFACLSLGMLFSYLPKWSPKKFNVNAVIVAILVPFMIYLAYAPKNYLICLCMIALFAVLTYFSSNVNLNGKTFNLLGKMSSRMYVYMSFVSMLCVLGFDNCVMLFIIDICLSILDLLINYYYKKYNIYNNLAI